MSSAPAKIYSAEPKKCPPKLGVTHSNHIQINNEYLRYLKEQLFHNGIEMADSSSSLVSWRFSMVHEGIAFTNELLKFTVTPNKAHLPKVPPPSLWLGYVHSWGEWDKYPTFWGWLSSCKIQGREQMHNIRHLHSLSEVYLRGWGKLGVHCFPSKVFLQASPPNPVPCLAPL